MQCGDEFSGKWQRAPPHRRGSQGERCKLPKRGLGQRRDRKCIPDALRAQKRRLVAVRVITKLQMLFYCGKWTYAIVKLLENVATHLVGQCNVTCLRH